MKGSCSLVASVFAASTVALTSSSSSGGRDGAFNPCCKEGLPLSLGKNNTEISHTSSSADKEKFAPRFDGLRFIETLVTAHR
ncbi:hypothetical protein AAG906_033528 [Vitis piasezkii]|uniref:Uncharacterized protein n=1 Tax=Vitis vinifera TaxID=29760 RepID=D7TVT4_VITVI